MRWCVYALRAIALFCVFPGGSRP